MSVIRSSNVVGSAVNMTFQFTSTYNVGDANGAFFYAVIPNDFLYAGSSITCGVNSVVPITSGRVC